MALLKIAVQEPRETSRSRTITACTTSVAWVTSDRVERSAETFIVGAEETTREFIVARTVALGQDGLPTIQPPVPLAGQGVYSPLPRSGRGVGGESRASCDRSATGNLAGILRFASTHAIVTRARARRSSARRANCSNTIEQI